MCGDNNSFVNNSRKSCGSPPRVWGQLHQRRCTLCESRFTPTCVGTTSGCVDWAGATAVHPHVCGDNRVSREMLTAWGGSPPRVWGQRARGRRHSTRRRFTPTCVGTTINHAVDDRGCTVHPHVCGDNHLRLRGFGGHGGSPPRVWGQLLLRELSAAQRRFTPTCVGTTTQQHENRKRTAVHPHVCGDNCFCASYQRPNGGSPPRVWGQLLALHGLIFFNRFTPTCVGTTSVMPCSAYKCTVHPHVCGDNVHNRRNGKCSDGSPPRVWGQQLECPVCKVAHRFTPTCVGTTVQLQTS